jgi:2-haloalkanoic acid dehalogenase type II
MTPLLTDFKALSFDCYGTLIDWELGIFNCAQPFRDMLPEYHPWQHKDELIARFNTLQAIRIREAEPMPYNHLLSDCYATMVKEAGVQLPEAVIESFGNSVGDWPAFPDTVDGLQRLSKRYKLIILSNVDRENMSNTLGGPLTGVNFDRVLVAGEIGTYKPNHRNFETLFQVLDSEFGLERQDLLHVAKSLPVDHVPAKSLGMTSAWIARGAHGNGLSAMGGHLEEFKDEVAFMWRFPSIGEMANEVDAAFTSRSFQ